MSRKMKYSGIEWIGVIPEDWEVRKYKNYCNVFAGGTPDTGKTEYWDGNVPWIQSGKIQNCDIYDCSRYITEIGLKNSSTKMINKGTALLAMTGATCGNVGYLHFDSCANQSVMAFVPITKAISSRYIYYSLMTQKDAISITQNGSAQGGINVENGKNLFFTIPSAEEQQIIANFLDQKVSEINHILEKTRESIKEYKKYKQSIITEALTKGLNPNVEMKDSGIEWIGEIPKHWEVKRMKQISQLNPSCKTSGLYDDSIVTFTPMECLYNGYFENREGLYGNINSSYTPFQNQDIIIAKVTPCFENGNIAIADNLFNGFGYGSSELFVIRCTDVFNKFIFYYLQNKNFIEEASSTMTGVAGLKRVSSYFMKNAHVSIPNIEEQHKIVNYLDSKISEIDNLISQKGTLLKDLELYKKSLIYECVTGKREVV